jgi:hypothetical protein
MSFPMRSAVSPPSPTYAPHALGRALDACAARASALCAGRPSTLPPAPAILLPLGRGRIGQASGRLQGSFREAVATAPAAAPDRVRYGPRGRSQAGHRQVTGRPRAGQGQDRARTGPGQDQDRGAGKVPKPQGPYSPLRVGSVTDQARPSANGARRGASPLLRGRREFRPPVPAKPGDGMPTPPDRCRRRCVPPPPSNGRCAGQ